ncbi:IclR family transcriptional regulator domain-containing protein [Actinacidiphila bryophytorum]|uniref:IclR family transcriptional regulator n=1 Tax=Actinacidiphila bryophytorum TaxID=1436133 RepID=A0A9W4ED05_9ACTN|nr:IclR family transcriptional regulator C-terminal domain-containing protein [Actinacidiphila bryophytorum]MBM9438503.1 helix-turn-helix domain-containing protein [Actinacidiphila bryophytorum]MBN6543697.1 helix-turn-helix domain-containing protein [Actinacidiphila bryophytorum]CAG7612975.1 IclR family transcriptional regulator [Actinacidiphila bryophytorum]
MPPTGSADASVGPLERGLAVLRLVAHAPGGRLRASELARATGLARSTVDRIAATLVRLAYLREEERALVLAPPLMALGAAYLRSSGIPAALGPLAAELAEELDESVSLAVPDGDAVRFVVQNTRRRTLSVSFRVGDALPAERCAPGAIFAADWSAGQWAAWRRRSLADPRDEGFPAVPRPSAPHLPEDGFRALAAAAGERGWAVDDQLVEPGLVAVAVPVLDPGGRVVCALSIVSHTSRHGADRLRELAWDRLQRTAGRMTAALKAPAAGRPAPAAADATADAKRAAGPQYLQSLARGLAVLTALGEGPGGMTLSEVAHATGLARATARRSLLTLQELGYATSDERLFRPLPRVLDLGYAPLSGLALGEIAAPHLAELVRRVNDSASVAVLDGDDIRYVVRVAASRTVRVALAPGTRLPAHATSLGRVLLAALPAAERERWLSGAGLRPLTGLTLTDPAGLAVVLDRVADDGFALVDQELEEGLRSVAVPVRGRGGQVVAAANVSLHAGRTSAEEARTRVLPALRETAARISADLAVVGDSQLPAPD